MRNAVARALEELERSGATVTVIGANLCVSYRCQPSAIPAVKAAIAVLKQHKSEALASLARKERVGGPESQSWSPESLEAQRKFGEPSARLYPLIGLRVRTPRGTGKLLQVFVDRAAVLIDGENQVSSLAPVDVLPELM